MAHERLIRTLRYLEPRRPGPRLTWSPLLVLGLSVIASVVLISAGMAMLGPEAEAETEAGTEASARGLPAIVAVR